jgi:hypothetical protein
VRQGLRTLSVRADLFRGEEVRGPIFMSLADCTKDVRRFSSVFVWRAEDEEMT